MSSSISTELETLRRDPYDELITCIISNLFSFDIRRQELALKQYYFENAVFRSPILTTSGVEHIQRVLLVWRMLNKVEPKIDNICFDGRSICNIFLTQTICPRLMPFAHLSLPVIVTLHFKSVDNSARLIKVAMHEEHWTVQGLIQAVPFASVWYHKLVRVTAGRMLTTAGALVHTAAETANLLARRNGEIEQARKELVYRKRSQ